MHKLYNNGDYVFTPTVRMITHIDSPKKDTSNLKRYCHKCGSITKLELDFCSYCGEDV